MPARGVAGLRSARLANSLIEFLDDAKEADAVKIFCPEHRKELESFCYDCGECLCCECALRHDEHVCADIDEAFERYKTEVLPQLVEEYAQAKELDKELPNVCRAKRELTLARLGHLLESFKKHLITEDKIEALKNLWITEKKSREELNTKCYATGRGLVKADVGSTAIFILHTISKNEGRNTVECLLVSERSDSRVLGSVKKLGEYKYEISYKPVTEGRHQLCVLISGKQIKGSPFTVDVAVCASLRGAYGIAISRGEIFVSEMEGNCITVFSCTILRSYATRSFGTHGSGLGQLDAPHGVAVDDEGNVLVADGNNHRIQKFTKHGEYLQAVGSKGSGRLQFTFPRGIAVNPVTKMVYVVDANHRVQVLNSDFTYFKKIGKRRQFNYPQGIACDSTGKVYVADTGNKCIQVFTAEGGLLRIFATTNFPISIAVDSKNSVYVGENGCHHISVFTPEGIRITSSFSKCPNPLTIAVDTSRLVEFLYACDNTGGTSVRLLSKSVYYPLGIMMLLTFLITSITLLILRP